MDFGQIEPIIERYPQIQIYSHKGEELDSVITHFLKQKENVSTLSESIQQKIKQALAPFWQQRFISLYDKDDLYVKNLLLDKKFFLKTDRFVEDIPFPLTDEKKLKEALEIADLPKEILERKLLSLSNGELRRILLARMYMENAKWFYFNDLFGGLDPEYREHLKNYILRIQKTNNVKMIIRLAREDEILPDIPAFIYENGYFKEVKGYRQSNCFPLKYVNKKIEEYEKVMLSDISIPQDSEILFELKQVNVHFGETEIIKNLNWTIRKGEHWVVMGENGAGKSTLLALLTADHPQIYGNNITLLGNSPGQGLDVWKHKEKLGFFSPELALQYREDLNIFEVLCTGFTTNLCRGENITWEEKKKAKEWLDYLGFKNYEENIRHLSPIDKRIVLMARAAIKPPKVLLLDEPTQGLRIEYREKFFNLLNLLSKETTIILVSHYEEEWPSCMTHLLKMPKFS